MKRLGFTALSLLALGCGGGDDGGPSASEPDAGELDASTDATPDHDSPDGDFDAALDAGDSGDASDAATLCVPGSTQQCYDGAAQTLGVGLCVAGEQTCAADGASFGPCEGQVLPADEICATPGDDDCDGQANEGGVDCVCTPGESQSCYSGPPGTLGTGPCQGGVQVCLSTGDGWGTCVGEIPPKEESCLTDLDDDCDGELNEGGIGCLCKPFGVEACYAGPPGTEWVGICKVGQRFCNSSGTQWGVCNGEVLPKAAEDCDTPLDDDCDGAVNEGNAGCACVPGSTQSCYQGPGGTANKGLCKSGIETCVSDGTGWGPCVGQVLPKPETCGDPGDEDCDGKTNEEGADCVCIPNQQYGCYTGPPNTEWYGQCVGGYQTCAADGLSIGPCLGQTLPGVEDCGNLIDEDCDGNVSEEGPSCVCHTTDPTLPCYTGPAGTEDVGICHGGDSPCDSDGTGWTDCYGEQTPVLENCASTPDEACDGSPGASCALAVWAKSFEQTVTLDVAVGPNDGVFVGGTSNLDLDLGGGPLPKGTGTDMFVGHFASSGAHLWSRRFDGLGDETLTDFAVTPSGEVVLVGSCIGYVSFDAHALTCDAAGDAVVVKLNASGVTTWAGAHGDAWVQRVEAVTLDSAGNAYVAGRYSGSLDFGGPPLSSVPVGGVNLFIAKLGTAGNQVWLKGFPVTGSGALVAVNALTTAPNGDFLVVGRLLGTMNLGGGNLTVFTSARAFVARFDSAGQHVFSAVSGNSQTNAVDVGVDAAGNARVIVTGSSLTLGGVSASGGQSFLAHIGPTGTVPWIKAFPFVSSTIQARSDGTAVVGGHYTSAMNLGFGQVLGPGLKNALLVGLDTAATPLWARSFGLAKDDYVTDVALDSSGHMIAGGRFEGTVDVGGASLSSSTPNTFLVRYTP